jgi:5-methylcytosine-specific restriction protein A
MAKNAVSNEGGSTRQWRNLRREIIARDKGKCKICGSAGSVVDHIKPRSKGGADDKSNLRLICKTCDKRLRAKQAAASAKKSLDQLQSRVDEIVKRLG